VTGSQLEVLFVQAASSSTDNLGNKSELF